MVVKSSKSKVRKLQQVVFASEEEINRIQRSCKHNKMLVSAGVDIYAGWGYQEVCLICDKVVIISTRARIDGDKPYKKIVNKKE